jgi:hypothetical protein
MRPRSFLERSQVEPQEAQIDALIKPSLPFVLCGNFRDWFAFIKPPLNSLFQSRRLFHKRLRHPPPPKRSIHVNETAPAVGLLLHKTDSDLHKLPALTHLRRLHLIFRQGSVAFGLPFSPRSLRAMAALAIEPTVYAANRNGNHNHENLFDQFARHCALCR